MRVSIPLRSADGRYEVVAQAILMLPACDPVPVFTRNGQITTEVVMIETAAEADKPMKQVLNAHTVCVGPDGKIKWEVDARLGDVPPGTLSIMGTVPPFQLGTNQIKTGKEHF